MPTILLIDDDPTLLDVLSLALEEAGHRVVRATDGMAGLTMLEAERPDVIVSDVNMPRLDGFALCRKLRAQDDATPIILLTSRTEEIDEALGLELGADDYVTKPFSTRVLLARIGALVRREQLRGDGQSIREPLVVRNLTLDADRLEATYAGEIVATTVTEFRLLEVLCGAPGTVFSRETILDRIRGDGVVVDRRIVDTYVRRLRRRFEALDGEFDAIETVVGAGYRWSASGR
jgi:DNA-binding response OmpR family regulator